jgi:hypothetical protein
LFKLVKNGKANSKNWKNNLVTGLFNFDNIFSAASISLELTASVKYKRKGPYCSNILDTTLRTGLYDRCRLHLQYFVYQTI